MNVSLDIVDYRFKAPKQNLYSLFKKLIAWFQFIFRHLRSKISIVIERKTKIELVAKSDFISHMKPKKHEMKYQCGCNVSIIGLASKQTDTTTGRISPQFLCIFQN